MDTDLVVTGKAKTGYLEDIRKLVDEWGLIVHKSNPCVAMDTIEFMSYYTDSYIIPGQMHQEERTLETLRPWATFRLRPSVKRKRTVFLMRREWPMAMTLIKRRMKVNR